MPLHAEHHQCTHVSSCMHAKAYPCVCAACHTRRQSAGRRTSSASRADLKRRDRCWFILARGATPEDRAATASARSLLARCVSFGGASKAGPPCGARGRTVDSHEEQLLWLHDLDQLLQVRKDLDNHLRLCQPRAGVVAVRAVVDDAVHVQVQVVHDWHAGAGNGLVDERVALAEPAVKLWDACARSAATVLNVRDTRLKRLTTMV